jgi:hypothetical protein
VSVADYTRSYYQEVEVIARQIDQHSVERIIDILVEVRQSGVVGVVGRDGGYTRQVADAATETELHRTSAVRRLIANLRPMTF